MSRQEEYHNQASKSWRVLECNPRWGLDGKAKGREVYLEIDGDWGDCAKDAALIQSAPSMKLALEAIASLEPGELDFEALATMMRVIAKVELAKTFDEMVAPINEAIEAATC